jgi:hypothetical protein
MKTTSNIIDFNKYKKAKQRGISVVVNDSFDTATFTYTITNDKGEIFELEIPYPNYDSYFDS